MFTLHWLCWPFHSVGQYKIALGHSTLGGFIDLSGSGLRKKCKILSLPAKNVFPACCEIVEQLADRKKLNDG